jgi:hypothetical protein
MVWTLDIGLGRFYKDFGRFAFQLTNSSLDGHWTVLWTLDLDSKKRKLTDTGFFGFSWILDAFGLSLDIGQ